MSLAFLTSDSAEAVARSPMERLAVSAGARLQAAGGWNVALDYGNPAQESAWLSQTVGFADRSSLGKLELQAEPDVLAGILQQAGGVKLDGSLASRTVGSWWCQVTPARVLVLSEPAVAAEVRASLGDAAQQAGGATLVDVTCGLAAMSIAGPRARDVLARFCALDVRPQVAPPHAFRPGSIARTPGYLLLETEHSLLALVGSALGRYLWEVVADAAGNLGGGPVGADALAVHLEAVDA